MNRSELERFTLAMQIICAELTEQERMLTERDLHLLQAGMRAVFIVEAQAHGDDARTETHRRALGKLLQHGAPVSGTIANAKASNDR